MKRQGFSLIELLVAAAILGVLLAMLGAFFSSQQRVTSQQVTQATLNNDARLAMLRMGDIITQASYIYPAGQTITVTGGDETNYQVTTGENAVAVLLPRLANDDEPLLASPYCGNDATEERYCGFIFAIEEADAYVGILGDTDGTGSVLVERRVLSIDWDAGDIPTKNWDASSVNVSPLANSVLLESGESDEDEEAPFTSLGAKENLALAGIASEFDDGIKTFSFAEGTPTDQENALINSIDMTLVLQAPIRGQDLTSERSSIFFTRSVPRESLPN